MKKEVHRLLPSIYTYSLEDWQDWLEKNGQPKFRSGQIFDWLYKKRVTTIEEMTNLSKDLRAKLAEQFRFTTLKPLVHQISQDGTQKFLFELQDGNAIETVLMKHDYGNSVCVTTQVGCRIGCTFCASTLGGLQRNLESGEIVAQVLAVQQELDRTNERVSQIVVMGIGEPFDNYDALIKFLRIVNDKKGLHIGARHITVSTSGIVPKIYTFAKEGMQVNFAISLHAPNDVLRTQMMPINRAYPLKELMTAVADYIQTTNRRVTFEYGLTHVNDSEAHALELANLIRGLKCHVNLIQINHVQERFYQRTTQSQIQKFANILKKQGINVTIRREQGHDIDAACGQLRAKKSGHLK